VTHATPSHETAPAPSVMKGDSEMVEFTCQVTLADGMPCGAKDVRVRPRRGPAPSVCDACLWWSKHGTHASKRRPRSDEEARLLMHRFPTGSPHSSSHDNHATALRDAVAPKAVEEDPRGVLRFGERIVAEKQARQRDGLPTEWTEEEIAATAAKEDGA